MSEEPSHLGIVVVNRRSFLGQDNILNVRISGRHVVQLEDFLFERFSMLKKVEQAVPTHTSSLH